MPRAISHLIIVTLTTVLFVPGMAQSMEKEAFKRPLKVSFPEDAPYSPLRATLGKMLFFDPRLSGAQNISCATCHNPSFGWEVPTPGPVGATNVMLARQAPTILNAAWTTHLFWDGRADSLEEQAIGPISADVEMAGDLEEIAAHLGEIATYANAFERAYPGEGMTPNTILNAIATFERTIVSGWSPFDRWVEGDATAISEAARRGFDVFVGDGRCADCHSGWNFTDNAFHDIGLATDDAGRIAVTQGPEKDRHAFKTPGLRNILYRAPYMHNGSLPTISSVIDHYVSGGIERASRSEQMHELHLSEDQISDLIAFLGSLTAEEDAISNPILPAE